MRLQMKLFFLFFFFSLLLMCSKNTTVQVKTKENIASAREALETARYYVKLTKYKKAITFYNIVLTDYKDKKQEASWAVYEKAYCYYKLKNYEIALQTFKRVSIVYPDEYGPIKLAQKMISQIELVK